MGVMDSLNGLFDKLFGWAIAYDPTLGLLFITFVMTLIITLAYKYLTDQEKMKKLKGELKEIQDKSKKAKDDPAKVKEHTAEMWQKNMEYMKSSFSVMLYTLIPFFVLFAWLKTAFEGIDLNFLGFIDSWYWVYIIFSLILSSVMRKVMKVH